MVDSKEEQFGRAVDWIQTVGLWAIMLSGLAITAIHISSGSLAIVLQPAFLFKWALILFLFGASLFRQKNAYPHFIWEGVVGANWYALFVVHILAPVTTWADLLVLYAIWTVGFVLCYVAIVYAMHETGAAPHRTKPHAPRPAEQKKAPPPPPEPRVAAQSAAPRPVPKPAPQPVAVKPIVKPLVAAVPVLSAHIPAPLPAVEKEAPHMLQVKPIAPVPPPKPAVPVPPKPAMQIPHKPLAVPPKPVQKITDPDENPGLPAIRVMPRTPADVDRQNRATTVQFS
jgi:hypothetical protein